MSKNKASFNDGIAALSTSIIYTMGAYSFAALIFTGPLIPYVIYGFNLILISNIVGCLFATRFSSYPILSSLTPPSLLILYSLITAALVANLAAIHPGMAPIHTVYSALILLTVLVGIVLWATGRFRAGNIVRFIPFPAIAAFLAATGWILIEVSIKLIIGKPLREVHLLLLTSEQWLQLSLSFGMVIGTLILQRWFSRTLVEPCFFITALLVFYFLIYVTNASTVDLKAMGWYIETVTTPGFSNPLKLFSLSQTDWRAFLDWNIAGNILAILIISPIFLLLSISGIEKETQHEFDFNHELKYAGTSNILAPLLGGGAIVGPALLGTTRNFELGAKSRWVGVFTCLFFALVLIFGTPLLQTIPLFIVASLPLLTGITLLRTWLVKTRERLNLVDYALLLFIFLVIVVESFLLGIVVGVIASLLLFGYRYSRINMIRNTLTGLQVHSNDEHSMAAESLLYHLRSRIEIIILQGYLFFGNLNTLIGNLINRIEHLGQSKLFFIILDFRNVQGIDAASMESFFRLYTHAVKNDVRLVFTHLSPKTYKNILQTLKLTASNDYCLNFETLDYGLEWCEDWLLKQKLPDWHTDFGGQLHLIFPDEKELNSFKTYLEAFKAKADQIIFSEGEEAHNIYFLESGILDIMHFNSGGVKVRIKTIHPGVFVGEIGIYLGISRTFSCVARTESSLYRLSFDNLVKMEKENPKLALIFHRYMVCQTLHRLNHTNKTILAMV